MAGRAKQNYTTTKAQQSNVDAGDSVEQVKTLQRRVLNLNDRVTSLEREVSRTQERIQGDMNKLVTLVNEIKSSDPNNPYKTFSG